jgi:hypothetical protein
MISLMRENKIFKTDTEYMNKIEIEEFNNLVLAGHITFFGTSSCETCGKDIIKGKKYCSYECVPKEEKSDEEKDDEDMYW